MSDQLWNRHGKTDRESSRKRVVAEADRSAKLLTNIKDAVCVVENRATEVGQHEPATAAQEQRVTHLLFERFDLGADRRWTDVEPPSRLYDTAFSGDCAEIEQVVKIQGLQSVDP
jgi:hypothetical protein